MNSDSSTGGRSPTARGTVTYWPAPENQPPSQTDGPNLDVGYWYRNATMPLYGLPPAWQGHRGIGSPSLDRVGDGYQANRLTLTHDGPDGARIAVTTYHAGTSGRFVIAMVARDLAREIAAPLRRTGDITAYRRLATETKNRLRADAKWQDYPIAIDGTLTFFHVLSADNSWSGYTRHHDILIQLTATRMPPSQVALIAITDPSIYLGSEEESRRG